MRLFVLLVLLVAMIALALGCDPDPASRVPLGVRQSTYDGRASGLVCLPRGFAVAGPIGGTPLTLREEQPERPAAYTTIFARVVECGADPVLCPCNPATPAGSR